MEFSNIIFNATRKQVQSKDFKISVTTAKIRLDREESKQREMKEKKYRELNRLSIRRSQAPQAKTYLKVKSTS